MPKFLKAARSSSTGDPADPPVAPGEWLTAGSFALCDLAEGYRCDPPCGCDRTFLAADCRSRCAVAEVVEIDAGGLAETQARLMESLVRAPSPLDHQAAQKVMEKEMRYTLCLAASFAAGTRIRVSRRAGLDGSVEEKYDQCDPTPEIRVEP